MRALPLLSVLLLIAAPAAAGPVDGSTADWGTIQTNAADNRLLDISFDPDVHAFVEDSAGSNFVGPGYGGQDYDVEAVFFRWSQGTLSGGLLTGFDLLAGEPVQSGSSQRFASGDFLLDIGCDGGFDLALDFSSYDGSTMDLIALAGDNSDLEDVFYAAHAAANPWRWNEAAGGTLLGSVAAYAGPALGLAGDHQFFEFGFDFVGLVGFKPDCIGTHWTMECGNDFGHAEAPVPQPEPGTFVLVALALAGLVWQARRRRAAA